MRPKKQETSNSAQLCSFWLAAPLKRLNPLCKKKIFAHANTESRSFCQTQEFPHPSFRVNLRPFAGGHSIRMLFEGLFGTFPARQTQQTCCSLKQEMPRSTRRSTGVNSKRLSRSCPGGRQRERKRDRGTDGEKGLSVCQIPLIQYRFCRNLQNPKNI